MTSTLRSRAGEDSENALTKSTDKLHEMLMKGGGRFQKSENYADVI